ncbi:hypothetical protein AB0M80_42280 [Amycolatopsis sp. NPDC051045]|uniref:hypothetical protein n=1 Tax=Amycolatopsis sp. NPDC051045 TaxID=3156922 RepID=UPI00343CF8AE
MSRDDLAEAAAVRAYGTRRVRRVRADRAAEFSYDGLAALVRDVTGKPLAHRSFTAAELLAQYLAAGLPSFGTELLADVQNGVRDGRYRTVTPDCRDLLGRPAVRARRADRGCADFMTRSVYRVRSRCSAPAPSGRPT